MEISWIGSFSLTKRGNQPFKVGEIRSDGSRIKQGPRVTWSGLFHRVVVGLEHIVVICQSGKDMRKPNIQELWDLIEALGWSIMENSKKRETGTRSSLHQNWRRRRRRRWRRRWRWRWSWMKMKSCQVSIPFQKKQWLMVMVRKTYWSGDDLSRCYKGEGRVPTLS